VTRTLLALVLTAAVGLSACSAAGTAPTATPAASEARMGAWSPSQLGLVAATGDPAVMPSTPGFSPGILYVSRVYVDQARASRVAHLAVIAPGEGITNAFVGVYDPGAGKLLAATGDLSGPLQAGGIVDAPFTKELPAEPMNKELWLVLLIGGMTKSPTMIGGREYGTNLGLTSDYRLWVSASDKFTALPEAIPELKVPVHGSIPFVAIGP